MANTAYSTTFYEAQQDASYTAAREVLPIVFSIIPTKSMLDVGCGVGPWVAAAVELGASDSLGMDGSYVKPSLLQIPPALFHAADLTQPVDLHRKFDLVISLEVAEHILPESADIFVQTLTTHGDAILFSAAIPGQGGTLHYNEQWPAYWEKKFAAHGFKRFDVIRSHIWTNQKIPCQYRQNAFLYLKEDKLDQYPLATAALADNKPPVALVHPDVFRTVITNQLSLRRVVTEFPGAVRMSLKYRLLRLRGK